MVRTENGRSDLVLRSSDNGLGRRRQKQSQLMGATSGNEGGGGRINQGSRHGRLSSSANESRSMGNHDHQEEEKGVGDGGGVPSGNGDSKNKVWYDIMGKEREREGGECGGQTV